MPVRALILALLGGCASGDPATFPVGGSSVGTLHLSYDDDDDAYTASISFHAWAGPSDELALDTCVEGPPASGAVAIDLDAGAAWLYLDGDRVDLTERSATEGGVASPGFEPITLEPPPFGRAVGVGWTGGDGDDGNDLDAFDLPDALHVPDALDLRHPSSDEVERVPAGEDLEVRWRGHSPGVVYLSVYVTADVAVHCRAADDGRFDVPAALLARARGETALRATRVVVAYVEVEPDAYFTVGAWHAATRLVRFE